MPKRKKKGDESPVNDVAPAPAPALEEKDVGLIEPPVDISDSDVPVEMSDSDVPVEMSDSDVSVEMSDSDVPAEFTEGYGQRRWSKRRNYQVV